MTRHYMHKDGTAVFTVGLHAYEVPADDNYTEVRVVPLDSVIIDGPLPEVEHDETGTFVRMAHRQGTSGPPVRMPSNPTEHTADEIYAHALACIALAAYLRTHPPLDEAQVKALADDITFGPENIGTRSENIARHLIARGWTKGGDPR